MQIDIMSSLSSLSQEELIETNKSIAATICDLFNHVRAGRVSANDAIDRLRQFTTLLTTAADNSSNRCIYIPLLSFCAQVDTALRAQAN